MNQYVIATHLFIEVLYSIDSGSFHLWYVMTKGTEKQHQCYHSVWSLLFPLYCT